MAARPFTPRPYQEIIIEHILTHPRCAVWAGMGMGKTVSALTAISTLQLLDDTPVLVLAPKRVATQTWPQEAKKWAHTADMTVVPIIGTERQRMQAVNTPANVYTTNYENLPWLVEYLRDRWPFRTVIADESTRLKSFRLKQGGRRAAALGRVAHSAIERFVELTGTPAPNGLLDLWGQAWFIDAGQRLGRTFSAYRDRWFAPHPSGFGYRALPHAQREIQERMADVCVTVDPRDWFDLRAPIETVVPVELPPNARAIYRDLERKMFAELECGTVLEATHAAAKTIKCLQLANGAVYTDETCTTWSAVHDEKIEALREIVEEASGAPVLVAYHFRSDLARLKKAFPQGREMDARGDVIEAWNRGEVPILFVHPASAGHGLNLQDGGNILVFFGHWWNLEERQQVIERIGPTRQMQAGYDRPVYIYDIVAKDTVDELVLERVRTKAEVQDILLAAMKRKGYKT